MADKDPRKRCFHCVFTNCPGTNGALGSITPELLASLFTSSEIPNKKKKKSKSHHGHHKNKRPRIHKDSLSEKEKGDEKKDGTTSSSNAEQESQTQS